MLKDSSLLFFEFYSAQPQLKITCPLPKGMSLLLKQKEAPTEEWPFLEQKFLEKRPFWKRSLFLKTVK